MICLCSLKDCHRSLDNSACHIGSRLSDRDCSFLGRERSNCERSRLENRWDSFASLTSRSNSWHFLDSFKPQSARCKRSDTRRRFYLSLNSSMKFMFEHILCNEKGAQKWIPSPRRLPLCSSFATETFSYSILLVARRRSCWAAALNEILISPRKSIYCK
jgi:hypothetical protein